jgi:hypothetical protein
MHYLVRLKAEELVRDEDVADRDDVYLSPEGDRGWAIFDADDEESLRQDLLQEGQEVEEVQPLLTAREYMAVLKAREDLESSKARFVDEPSEALSEGHRAVGRALEALGYPPPERADEAPQSRQEILREYQDVDTGELGSLEDMRGSFGRLSDLLDRLVRA